MEKKSCTLNPPVVNKTNILAALMVILGAACDPTYINLLPAAYAPKIIQISGLILMVLRTFFTGKPVEIDVDKPAG